MSRWLRAVAAALVALSFGAVTSRCFAGSLRFCDQQTPLSPGQQDTLLRFGAIIKGELERSGQGVALVSRSGLDLGRFGIRYSHAGFSLKASQNTPWSVRQLYYACDEHQPRIYDQGLSGFLLGLDTPAIGYVSVVFLPAARADEIEQAALDNRRALRLLGARYSANAYPFSARYQNCNQWVLELMAATWGRLDEGTDSTTDLRAQAQAWLQQAGYRPSAVEVGSRPLMWLGAFIPWLHDSDHPADDIDRMTYRVSLPASIEDFLHERLPGATRVEFCHNERQVVIRRGWVPIEEGCVAGVGDEVVMLE